MFQKNENKKKEFKYSIVHRVTGESIRCTNEYGILTFNEPFTVNSQWLIAAPLINFIEKRNVRCYYLMIKIKNEVLAVYTIWNSLNEYNIKGEWIEYHKTTSRLEVKISRTEAEMLFEKTYGRQKEAFSAMSGVAYVPSSSKYQNSTDQKTWQAFTEKLIIEQDARRNERTDH